MRNLNGNLHAYQHQQSKKNQSGDQEDASTSMTCCCLSVRIEMIQSKEEKHQRERTWYERDPFLKKGVASPTCMGAN